MAETTWQYFVQDYSPLLTYAGSGASASRSPNLDSAWQQSCPTDNSNNTLAVCDFSSTHTTNLSGASVSFPFYGQSIQVFGASTSGMQYEVNIDGLGKTSNGTTSDNVLASFIKLTPGQHTIRLTAQPSSNVVSTLSFQGAMVTVGTNLTGANVDRTIIQDDNSGINYNGSWVTKSFANEGIQSSPLNTTWHEIYAGYSGSFSIQFSGNAFFVHGVAWGFYSSSYGGFVDNNPSPTYYANSSLANSPNAPYAYTSGLMLFNADLNDGPHSLVLDNRGGIGWIGLDYVEVVSITGGTPLGSGSKSSPSIGVIVGSSAAGFLVVVAILYTLYCIINDRKELTTGWYTITNTKFGSHAILPNADDKTALTNADKSGHVGEIWYVERLDTGQYAITNDKFEHYASCDHRAELGSEVFGQAKKTTWIIKRAIRSNRWTIQTTDAQEPLYWGLEPERDIPITLRTSPADLKNQWMFERTKRPTYHLLSNEDK